MSKKYTDYPPNHVDHYFFQFIDLIEACKLNLPVEEKDRLLKDMNNILRMNYSGKDNIIRVINSKEL